MKDDLNNMGIKNVIELRHGESYQVDTNFKITSYQFGVFLDSSLVIECEGKKLLNLNDAKFMGTPLKSIDKKHGPFDFTFRSHSSANSRLSYKISDKPEEKVDDLEYYIKQFTQTVRAIRTKYAIPFASNQCHLHKDVLQFNTMARTPQMVADYFSKHHIDSPKLKVMVSGDIWDSEKGFNINKTDYFSNRDYHLKQYQLENQNKLDKQYELEEKAKLNMQLIEKYYQNFFNQLPFLIRIKFKNHPIVYVLKAGEKQYFIEIDIYNKKIKALNHVTDEVNKSQIHVSLFIFNMCMRMDLFSHLSISKRVLFYCSSETKKYIELLNRCYNFYKYHMFPISRVFSYRFFEYWILRWRESILYLQLIRDKVLYKQLCFEKYLKPII